MARSARSAAVALHHDQAQEDAASAQRERCHGEEDEEAERVHRTDLAVAVAVRRWDRAGRLGSPERVRSIPRSLNAPARAPCSGKLTSPPSKLAFRLTEAAKRRGAVPLVGIVALGGEMAAMLGARYDNPPASAPIASDIAHKPSLCPPFKPAAGKPTCKFRYLGTATSLATLSATRTEEA